MAHSVGSLVHGQLAPLIYACGKAAYEQSRQQRKPLHGRETEKRGKRLESYKDAFGGTLP